MNFSSLLAVALGGMLGSSLRWAATFLCAAYVGTAFPYGTLLVNSAGSLLIGFLSLLLSSLSPRPEVALFLITGCLGGFTTFSSMMNETLQYISAGELPQGIFYVALQIILGLVFAALGAWIGKIIL